MRRRYWLAGVACLTVWLVAAAAEPVVVPLPAGALVPDVAVDARGAVHLVYALGRDAWYVRSTDDGATLSPPVRVNAEGTVENRMGERGPKLALTPQGTVHVVWADYWQPGVKTFVRYARSTDGGANFGPRQTLSSMSGVDGVCATADGAGHVVAFWHAMAEPKPPVPQATWLHMARSTDSGATWSHDEQVQIENLSPVACSMCLMRPRITSAGQVVLAFRTAVDNVRDFWLLRGAPTDNHFTAVRVNQDNWQLNTCPMCGPELTVDPVGRLLCAYMSRHRVYWSVGDAGASRFALHVPTPRNENDEIYPVALANRAGEVMFVWQVGPMSVTGSATLQWATYGSDGTATGAAGVLGTTVSGTKAAAFVGSDDRFRVVTTAR